MEVHRQHDEEQSAQNGPDHSKNYHSLTQS
jgi:hypothetical protein